MVTGHNVPEPCAQSFAPKDLALLDQVEGALESARSLKAWWQQKNETDSYATKFNLIRAFNPPSASFGFFDQARIGERSYPVMGSVEEMLFDTSKRASANRMRDEFREFVLRYFMRVSDYRPPEVYGDADLPVVSPFLLPLSWCPQPSAREGFGFSQHFYKLRGSDCIGRFPESHRYSIVDLREVRAKYDWIVLKVRIFDFNLKFAPFGASSLQLELPLKEESYLLLSPDL